MTFDIAIAAIRGARRYQEDTAMFDPAAGGRTVAVLADGMGGHAGGAEASRIACDTFLRVCREGATTAVPDLLLRALDDANRAIAAAADASPENAGMGCTIVGAIFEPEGMSWVSVGDSLLYLWRRGSLAQLNDDHSLAPEIDRLAEAGVISWDEAASDPRRHYLRSALTGEDIELVDSPPSPIPLGAGDVLLIASDGLDTLDAEKIAALVAAESQTTASRIVDSIVHAVEDAGAFGQDNTTVIAIRVTA